MWQWRIDSITLGDFVHPQEVPGNNGIRTIPGESTEWSMGGRCRYEASKRVYCSLEAFCLLPFDKSEVPGGQLCNVSSIKDQPVIDNSIRAMRKAGLKGEPLALLPGGEELG